MCFDYEEPVFFVEIAATARKPHVCCECGAAIEPGERYHVFTGRWSRSFKTFKTCLSCDAERRRIRDIEAARGSDSPWPPFGHLARHLPDYAEPMGAKNAER